jgi:hypothetical protein
MYPDTGIDTRKWAQQNVKARDGKPGGASPERSRGGTGRKRASKRGGTKRSSKAR